MSKLRRCPSGWPRLVSQCLERRENLDPFPRLRGKVPKADGGKSEHAVVITRAFAAASVPLASHPLPAGATFPPSGGREDERASALLVSPGRDSPANVWSDENPPPTGKGRRARFGLPVSPGRDLPAHVAPNRSIPSLSSCSSAVRSSSARACRETPCALRRSARAASAACRNGSAPPRPDSWWPECGTARAPRPGGPATRARVHAAVRRRPSGNSDCSKTACRASRARLRNRCCWLAPAPGRPGSRHRSRTCP